MAVIGNLKVSPFRELFPQNQIEVKKKQSVSVATDKKETVTADIETTGSENNSHAGKTKKRVKVKY